MNEELIKSQIKDVSSIMYDKNFAPGKKGGISVRLDGNEYLFTSGNTALRALEARFLIKLDRDEKIIKCAEGLKLPDTEKVHMCLYKNNPGIRAILNAYSENICAVKKPYEINSDLDIFPDIIKSRDIIFAEPGFDAFITEDRGVFIIGDELYSALDKLEELNFSAGKYIKSKIIK